MNNSFIFSRSSPPSRVRIVSETFRFLALSSRLKYITFLSLVISSSSKRKTCDQWRAEVPLISMRSTCSSSNVSLWRRRKKWNVENWWMCILINSRHFIFGRLLWLGNGLFVGLRNFATLRRRCSCVWFIFPRRMMHREWVGEREAVYNRAEADRPLGLRWVPTVILWVSHLIRYNYREEDTKHCLLWRKRCAG